MTLSLAEHVTGSTPHSTVALGDSLELLKRLPDASVSLILTDPPYHSTKKGNIYGDKAFQEDEHFLDWMEQFAVEWKRILRPSGTLYVFCSAEMSARLEVMMSKYVRPINHVTWTKPNLPGYDGWKGKMNKEQLRTWYPHSERILVFEHGSYGDINANRKSLMGEYLTQCRKAARISGKELTEITGAYGKVNHGGAVANWEAGRNIPSRAQYALIVAALESRGVEAMLPYEDIIRPMNVHGGVEFTDVWNFMSVRPYKGKHPAEKPIDMLRHIITASSYPGDVVLDCFAGSGSTGVAALELERLAVCMDIEEDWAERITRDLAQVEPLAEEAIPRRSVKQAPQRSFELVSNALFD
ncbi:site-specific DNA-methyltransferase [Cryobacterium sp. TMT2-15-1]|nr:site-specific DNA-methyltransferase [Cryobacterium sp. TMT2-15-1]